MAGWDCGSSSCSTICGSVCGYCGASCEGETASEWCLNHCGVNCTDQCSGSCSGTGSSSGGGDSGGDGCDDCNGYCYGTCGNSCGDNACDYGCDNSCGEGCSNGCTTTCQEDCDSALLSVYSEVIAGLDEKILAADMNNINTIIQYEMQKRSKIPNSQSFTQNAIATTTSITALQSDIKKMGYSITYPASNNGTILKNAGNELKDKAIQAYNDRINE